MSSVRAATVGYRSARMDAFLILHGWQGSGPEHWQRWLAERLRAAGATVAYPDLPNAGNPRLAAWRSALERELAALPPAPAVVCHSLGCLLWLHHAAEHGPGARALLVAPPSAAAGVPELADFFPAPTRVVLAPGSRLVCSDDDPYCPEGAAALYGPSLGVPVDVIPGGGHLNPDAGLGPWPRAEAWCHGASAVTSSRIAAG